MTWKDFLPQARAIVESYRDGAPIDFDPQNVEGWGAAVALTAAAVGAGATVYASNQASSSAAKANAQNAANVSDTNQLNYQQFQQSRGSTGSAIYPIYAAGTEQQLYSDATNAYNATGGANAPTLQSYQNIVGASLPTAQQATQAANGIFNGQTQSQELNNAAPVQQANLALAQTQKQSSLEALQQTLNNIKSIQAGKGYAGDSYTNQLLNFQARQGANTQGATAIAGANLQNAQQTQGIQQNAINRQLQNLSLPGQVAQQNIALAQAPTNAIDTNQVNRQNLFANFSLKQQAPFQYTAFQSQPTASTGQNIAQGVGQLTTGVGNLVANQQLISALTPQSSYVSPTSYNNPAYFNSGTAAAGYNANDIIPAENLSGVNFDGFN